MVDVLVALETFVDEHSRCGTLRSEHDGAHAWLACSCGVRIDHALTPRPGMPPAASDLQLPAGTGRRSWSHSARQ